MESQEEEREGVCTGLGETQGAKGEQWSSQDTFGQERLQGLLTVQRR